MGARNIGLISNFCASYCLDQKIHENDAPPKNFNSKPIAGQNPNYLWKHIYFLLFNWLIWVHLKFCINLIEEQKQNYSTQNIYFPPSNWVDLKFLAILFLGSKHSWKWGTPKKFYSKPIAGQNPNYVWKNIYFLLFNWLKWVHPKFCINLIEEQKQNYSTQNIYFRPFNWVDLKFLAILFFWIKKFYENEVPKKIYSKPIEERKSNYICQNI